MTVAELHRLAKARLRDAEVLYASKRYDGAVYLCGYAVEIALKAKLCRSLKWAEFPDTNKAFENYQSLRTHKLDVLLRFSGVEQKVKARRMAEWSIVAAWEPGTRYRRIGAATSGDARDMIESVKALMGVLW